MRFYWLVLGTLATWRITHLLQAEDGPWDLVARFRRKLGQSFWGKLLDCFYCLSIWLALPLALVLGESTKERLLLWPALSGGAILLERITYSAPPAQYFEDEDKEEDHAMLRRPENAGNRIDGPEPPAG